MRVLFYYILLLPAKKQNMYQEINEIYPVDAYEKIRNGALLLDIREPEEIEMFAFDVENQIFIPQGELALRMPEVPLDKEVIIGCHSGNRSRIATLFLMKERHKNVYNLRGGIRKWIELKLPVKWDNYQAEIVVKTSRI